MRPPTNPSDWMTREEHHKFYSGNHGNWVFYCEYPHAHTVFDVHIEMCHAPANWTLSPTYRIEMSENHAPPPLAWWMCDDHMRLTTAAERTPNTDAVEAVRELLKLTKGV